MAAAADTGTGRERATIRTQPTPLIGGHLTTLINLYLKIISFCICLHFVLRAHDVMHRQIGVEAREKEVPSKYYTA